MTVAGVGGRPLKFTSVDDLKKKCDKYFEDMAAEERPLTISGLALYLNTSRNTLLAYEEKSEFFNTIKEAKDKVLNYAEERLYGQGQVAGVIFNMKNNFGDTDKLDINADVNQTLNELSDEELDAKIQEKMDRLSEKE